MPYYFLEEDEKEPEEAESEEEFQFVEDQPEKKEAQFAPQSAGIKGFLKGIIDFGRLMGPLIDESPESAYQAIEEFLPTKGTPLEKGIERGTRIFPTTSAGGGKVPETLARSVLAGTAGQALEEAGIPEPIPTGAEIAAFGKPSATKKITPTQAQKQLVDFAKEQGLTDKQIAPLVAGDKKLKYLSKLAFRRGKTARILEDTKKGLGKIYGNLRQTEAAQAPLNDEIKRNFIQQTLKQLEEIPSSERDKVTNDLKDLLSKPMTGDTLMNFYHDLNHEISRGSTKLGPLKTPIEEAISHISPELNMDFKLTNQLYAKYAQARNALKPSLASDIVGASEALRFGVALMTGYYPVLVETVGEIASRKLASEMLTNPRLQNLSKKTIDALNAGKFAIATKLKFQMMDELDKDSEAYLLLEDMDFKELIE